MAKRSWKHKELVVSARNTEFPTIRLLIEDCLQEENIDKFRISEYVLLVEEIFVRAVEQIDDEDREITVTFNRKFTELHVELSFDGPRFKYDAEEMSGYDLGAKIINKYEDKIGVNYRRGHNSVTIQAARTYDGFMLANLVTTTLGIILGIYLYYYAGVQMKEGLLSILTALQTAFCTAVLMISAPVTFFSFVTNITNTVVFADKRVNLRNLISGIAISSVMALLIGAVYAICLSKALSINVNVKMAIDSAGVDILEEVEQIVPTDIFSAFTSASPFPLICLAIITAIAISTMNSQFDKVKSLNDTITGLFCQILHVIYMLLPFILFISFSYIVAYEGLKGVAICIGLFLTCLISMIMMFVVNCIRLKARGIRAWQFMKKCLPAFKENYRINSPIDAIPYNTRFCTKYLGIKMRYAESAMPIVSHLNLDGNCLLLSLISVFVLNIFSTNYDILTIVGLVIIIFGLSLGAPNQPGSLMIGLMVALSFLGDATNLFSLMIVIEAYVGRILTIINTMGNFTTIMIDATAAGELKNASH